MSCHKQLGSDQVVRFFSPYSQMGDYIHCLAEYRSMANLRQRTMINSPDLYTYVGGPKKNEIFS